MGNSFWRTYQMGLPTVCATDSNVDLLVSAKEFSERSNKPFKVIVAVDETREAEAAFEWYMRNLHRPDHVVDVLYSCDRHHPAGAHAPDYSHNPDNWFALMKVCGPVGMKVVEKYKAELTARKVAGDVSLALGPPGPTIVEYAEKIRADHIIMGTRSLGTVAGTVLGSVSRYVTQRSNVAVTVVPNVQRTKRENVPPRAPVSHQ